MIEYITPHRTNHWSEGGISRFHHARLALIGVASRLAQFNRSAARLVENMIEVGNKFRWELADIIRVNQFVRDKINLAAFNSWYEQLSGPEQSGLIGSLIFFAEQASGISDNDWQEALEASNLAYTNSSLFENRGKFLQRILAEFNDFDDWLEKLSEADRFAVFTFAVHLFGIAEGRVYRNEQKDWCNHWWHRDLLDERVVQDILDDPKYYMTSMKDDERVKNKTH